MNIEEAYLQQYSQELIEDPNLFAAQMAGGMEPAGAEPMSLGEFGMGAADTAAGLLKGAIQGTIGVVGDIESLVYGFREMLRRGADESALDAFISGLEQGTVLPTTEDVKRFLDEKVGPLVPAGASEKRREAAKTPEFVGELAGAGKTVKEAAKAVGRATKAIASTPPRGSIKLAEDSAIPTGAPSATSFVDIASISKLPVGPGSIQIKPIAAGKPLYRETNTSNVSGLLSQDKRFDIANMFVTDNPDLALGQGTNVGVQVKFRANALSGSENKKPGTGELAGREYVVDVIAPKAIESITFKNEKVMRELSARAKQVLRSDFERQDGDDGAVIFVRKGTQ